MKYISKTHLILLVIIVIILGGMLLLGEKYSQRSFFWKETSVPVAPIGTDEQTFLRDSGQPQSQLEMQMKSDSFIIRPGQNKLSYTDALDLYKNSLIQFNEDCQVSSGARAFGLNNEIMIDNRSSKPNTFIVGDSSVVVGPYDFNFLILKQKGDDIAIGCGDKRNVAIIVVQ
ncbi:MAG: hypothetical protein KBC11_02230 [Candidatus Pacebacteria bacterium]|nr:hypothetical protein [Candidatus Paceibacterota bacterium]